MKRKGSDKHRIEIRSISVEIYADGLDYCKFFRSHNLDVNRTDFGLIAVENPPALLQPINVSEIKPNLLKHLHNYTMILS